MEQNRAFLTSIVIAAVINLTPQSRSAEFKFESQTLTVPEGFQVEKIAGPPLVNRPIEADFDEKGRLFVSDSSGFSGKSAEQYKKKDHRIMRLVDTDGDGVFDKSTVFADGMMFPEGVLCHEGAVYVSAVPVIWKLVDTDDDGVADERTVWHDGKTMTGCANDLHGPYLGQDGWIYWTKGAFAEQTYERPGGRNVTDSAGHIFRRRADGSANDSIMSGGMDNPVGMTFTPAGDPIFTCTFFYRPHAGKKDALVHTTYGSVYGKVHGVLDGLVRTGELMPPMTQLGSAVPCGVTRYESQILGKDFQDNVFSCHFNLRRVQRHILKSSGSTFETEDSDFLVSDNPEFHPTDVFEDADGSLVVIDTGGWYRICCPTSQIAKPEVMGGIYRITRTDGKKVVDPRGLKLQWEEADEIELAGRLDDSRVAVKDRAIATLAKRDKKAVAVLSDVLKQSKSEQARLNAVWTLTRIDSAAARTSVHGALSDDSDQVRQAACHSAGIHRDADAYDGLVKCLEAESPHLRRKAATALGQLETKNAVSRLLDVLGESPDRSLEHALIYAMIEIGDADSLRKAIVKLSTQTEESAILKHRAALIALDQMDGGNLQADEVVPLLNSKQSARKEVASWIIQFHPEWGGELTDYYSGQLTSIDRLGEEERDALQTRIAQSAVTEPVQKLISTALSDLTTSEAARSVLLSAVSHTQMKHMPLSWTDGLAQSLGSSSLEVLKQAVAALRAVSPAKGSSTALEEPLLAVAGNAKHPAGLRLSALNVLSSIKRTTPPQAQFDLLLASISASSPPMDRIAAAGVLEKSKLNGAQLASLAVALRNINPMELSILLKPFKGCNEKTANLLIDSLSQSKVKSALRSDSFEPFLESFPPSIREKGEALLSSVNVGEKEQKQKLDRLEKIVAKGDGKRGHLVYNSQKAACSLCHSIGYVGGKMGPDLTRIGKIRTERDLLEAIVYPSSNFVRSYEPVSLKTRAGTTHYGILKEASSDHVALVLGPGGAEQLIAKSDIAEIEPGPVSLMPLGMDAVLSPQELGDLVVFLKSLQ